MKINRPTTSQIVAMALVPLLAVGLLLGLIGRGGEDRIEAAVVNLDEAVTIEDQIIPMGRQLAAAMVERDGDNISWTLADAPGAAKGLKSGRFSAVVTIPKNFSANATSWSANDAAKAEQARIQVTVSDNSPVTDAQLAEQIARLATDTINGQLTEGYLDGIYVGFNTLGEQFGEMIDGVNQLADGSAQLADGTRRSSDGAAELSDGMGLLRTNGGRLVDGGAQLAEGVGDLRSGVGLLRAGADQLAGGAGQLADGIDQFAGRTPEMVDGAQRLSGGATQLADGVGQLSGGIDAYADGVEEYAAGSQRYSGGVHQLADGAAELARGSQQFADGMDRFADGIDGEGGMVEQMPQLVDGVQQLADGADEYFAGVIEYANGTAALVDGLEQLRDGLQDAITGIEGLPEMDLSGLEELAQAVRETANGAVVLSNGLIQMDAALKAYASGQTAPPADVQALGAQLESTYQCPVEDPDTCALLRQAYRQGADDGVTAGFRAGTGLASTMLNQAGQDSAASLLASAQQLADAATVLANSIADYIESLPEDAQEQLAQLMDGLKMIAGAINTIATEAGPLKENAPMIIEGAEQLNAGIQELNTEIAALPEGVALLAEGARTLSDAAADLSGGTRQLANGTAGLAAGSDELADGARDLAAGARALSGGTGELAAGARSLADGTTQLTDGLAQLPAGVRQLQAGARGVADGTAGLAGGVGELDAGAGQLQDGAEDYVAGVGQYASGVRQAADGTIALSDGLSQLSDGAGELADGLEVFNTELSAGAKELPHYSAADREQLASVAASPVAQDEGLISASKIASTALLIVASLWLGALGAFAVWRPVPADVVTSRAASVALWARSIWKPLAVVVAQGLLLGLVGAVLLRLGIGTAAVLVLLMMLLGASFALANHALAGWLGNAGRAIAAVLLVVTIGLGLSSMVSWLAPIGAISPLQNGLELVRTHIADGSGEVGLASMAVLLGVVALAGSVTAISARRRLTPAQYRAAVG